MLTSSQLVDWEAYDRIEPIGQQRTDIMLATLCSLLKDSLSAIFSKKGKRPKPTPIVEWLPWMEEDYKRLKEKKDAEVGAIAIVKSAFGIE